MVFNDEPFKSTLVCGRNTDIAEKEDMEESILLDWGWYSLVNNDIPPCDCCCLELMSLSKLDLVLVVHAVSLSFYWKIGFPISLGLRITWPRSSNDLSTMRAMLSIYIAIYTLPNALLFGTCQYIGLDLIHVDIAVCRWRDICLTIAICVFISVTCLFVLTQRSKTRQKSCTKSKKKINKINKQNKWIFKSIVDEGE